MADVSPKQEQYAGEKTKQELSTGEKHEQNLSTEANIDVKTDVFPILKLAPEVQVHICKCADIVTSTCLGLTCKKLYRAHRAVHKTPVGLMEIGSPSGKRIMEAAAVEIKAVYPTTRSWLKLDDVVFLGFRIKEWMNEKLDVEKPEKMYVWKKIKGYYKFMTIEEENRLMAIKRVKEAARLQKLKLAELEATRVIGRRLSTGN